MKTMRNILAALAVMVFMASSPAGAAQERGRLAVDFQGILINAQALNGAPALRTFVVATKGYRTLLLHITYTHANNGALSFLPTSTEDLAGTSDFVMTTCSPLSGECTLNSVDTGATTASFSADAKRAVRIDITNYVFVKVIASHGGTPGAGDILTVKGWLIP